MSTLARYALGDLLGGTTHERLTNMGESQHWRIRLSSLLATKLLCKDSHLTASDVRLTASHAIACLGVPLHCRGVLRQGRLPQYSGAAQQRAQLQGHQEMFLAAAAAAAACMHARAHTHIHTQHMHAYA
eukprot:1141725-Pelagomonas_calceolata.AAC.1